MSGMQFRVTFFRDEFAREKWERDLTIHDLAERIRTATKPSKGQLPFLKLAAFGDRRTTKDSLRHDANVKWISGVEVDYDGGQMTFDDAVEILDKLGCMAILYTSPSHTEDSPRWRALCPLSTEMANDRRAQMLGRLNGAFRGIFARESWVLSQSYYYGSVNRNPSHRVEILDGHTIDQLDELDEIWMGPPGGAVSTGVDGIASAETREDAELIRCAVTGEHLHVELCALAARYVGRNIPAETVEGMLRGVMLSHPAGARDDRWQDRYDSIPELVASAVAKYRADDTTKRKTIAALACRLTRERRPSAEVRATVRAEAAAAGIPDPEAEGIMRWAARQEIARRGVAHAA